jgi:hypothetical protein
MHLISAKRVRVDRGVPLQTKLCLVLLLASIMLGCSHTYRLYPVQGPLAAQTPSLVLFVKVKGVEGTAGARSGSASVVLNDGEICNGRWTLVPRVQVPKDATAANAPATNGMSSVWDTVYGSGFYVSHVMGGRGFYAQAVVSGNRGTALDMEIYGLGTTTQNGPIGVAKDNKDNVYKMIW